MQAHKELDASASEVAELEDKLAASHRKLQRQEEERQETESARAEQGLQLDALDQDMKALQLALERVKQDRQQVCAFQNPPTRLLFPNSPAMLMAQKLLLAIVYMGSSVMVMATASHLHSVHDCVG